LAAAIAVATAHPCHNATVAPKATVLCCWWSWCAVPTRAGARQCLALSRPAWSLTIRPFAPAKG